MCSIVQKPICIRILDAFTYFGISISTQVIRSTKNVQIIIEQYRFRMDYGTADKTYWKCLNCKTRVITCQVVEHEDIVKIFKKNDSHRTIT